MSARYLKAMRSSPTGEYPRPLLPSEMEELAARHDDRVFGATLAGLALLGLIIAMCCGCAGWQANTRKALDAISRTAALVPNAAEGACRVLVRQCAERRENPCSAFALCRTVGKEAIRGAQAAQTAVAAGVAAVDVADKPSASAALQKALGLMGPVLATLKSYGVDLP